MSLTRHLSLYNGVSERSRGWKMRKSEKITGEHLGNMNIRRWDGAARSNSSWDSLRRDPELWYPDGDCYVHLYGQGQSRRGPAFKVSFATLLEANCYPLLERCMTNEISETTSSLADQHVHLARLSRQPRIELYIPAPPGSDKRQAFIYHLATRNLFAFIFRRSLVGEHLGTAIINLLHSLLEFRSTDADNITDLISYMDEEGYLDLKSQPTHALAVLHFAEVCQVRDLYIEAFAHCCGMSDRLFLGLEYQLLSSVTRRLLRRAHLQMEVKLGQMGRMLSTFFQDELSEAYLGLHPGARAHLECFRTLLHGFYAAKFGYFPPPSIHPRTTIFEVEVFQTFKKDFDALYHYLVDDSFEPSQGVLQSNQGGICTLQSVQSFDARCHFKTLAHPLPLLPNISSQGFTKRMNWFGRHSKFATNQRAESHVALVKATNENRLELLDNDLVRAYRKFEEDSIYLPIKGDKQEQLNHVDARKVRWILIYAVYQTIRHATEPPEEVRDGIDAPYSLCIPTDNLPPWKDVHGIPLGTKRQADQIPKSASISPNGVSVTTTAEPPTTPSFEIKPDIDYLGLLHRDEAQESDSGAPSPVVPISPARRTSVKRSLSRNRGFRRSLRLFGHQDNEKPPSPSKSKPQQYHEIVVLGYGNGTQDVEFTPREHGDGDALLISKTKTTVTASRSSSTASSSATSMTASASEDGSASTADTALTDSVANSPVIETKSDPWDIGFKKRHTQVSPPEHIIPRAMSMGSSSIRPTSLFFAERRTHKPQRSRSLLDRYRKNLEPSPLKIGRMPSNRPGCKQPESLVADDAETDDIWEDIEQFTTKMRTMSLRAADVNWDHYNDLGGFKDFNNVHPQRVSTIF